MVSASIHCNYTRESKGMHTFLWLDFIFNEDILSWVPMTPLLLHYFISSNNLSYLYLEFWIYKSKMVAWSYLNFICIYIYRAPSLEHVIISEGEGKRYFVIICNFLFFFYIIFFILFSSNQIYFITQDCQKQGKANERVIKIIKNLISSNEKSWIWVNVK